MAEDIKMGNHSFTVRDSLFSGEDSFYKKNPNVKGMYVEETDDITINPYTYPPLKPVERKGLIRLEAFRGAMSRDKIVPGFELTKEQTDWLKEAEYPEKAWKETIASRIVAGDPTAGGGDWKNVTEEQKKWVKDTLNIFKKSDYIPKKKMKVEMTPQSEKVYKEQND